MSKHRVQGFVFVVFLVAMTSTWSIHGRQDRADAQPGVLEVLPSALTPHAEALGKRVLAPGKERTTFSGELITEQGELRRMRVTLQLPSLVRIEGLRPDARAV